VTAAEQLERARQRSGGNEVELVSLFYELTSEWRAAGIDALVAVLQFIERHPDAEHGAVGPLVAYAETCVAYIDQLVESIARKPTYYTVVIMLRRWINGTQDRVARARYIDLMAQAAKHPAIDEASARIIADDVRALHMA
jgi:hypothetical protein